MLKWWMKTPAQKSFVLLLILVLFYVGAKIILLKDTPLQAIRVGSKNFTESLILGELYAQSLERAGFSVERKLNLGGTLIAHEALKKGEIDVYPEYTGTGWLDVLHQMPPRNAQKANQKLAAAYRNQWRLTWLKPASANNSQGLVMLRKTALRYQIRTLSELARQAPKLRLATIPEFDERPDGLKGLRQFYGGFQFRQVALFENGLKYQVLKQGEADVAVGFTTDSNLIDSQFILLKDDRHFWPLYQVAPVISLKALEKNPSIQVVLNHLSEILDTQTLQRLNRAVETERQDYRLVARHYLTGKPI